MKTVKRTDNDELLASLGHYGYSLMRPSAAVAPPEQVLKELLNQDDVRLLEGFPVVLLTALREKEALSWENNKWHSEELSKKMANRLVSMLALSGCLFQLFGLDKGFQARVSKMLSKFKWGKQTLLNLNESFTRSQPVKMDQVELSTERLKNNFRNYGILQDGGEEVREKKKVLELELLLSELFTPRQKELLNKRLQNKPMNKTEREYFYRVVKKRLKALASDELHQMARDVLMK